MNYNNLHLNFLLAYFLHNKKYAGREGSQITEGGKDEVHKQRRWASKRHYRLHMWLLPHKVWPKGTEGKRATIGGERW